MQIVLCCIEQRFPGVRLRRIGKTEDVADLCLSGIICRQFRLQLLPCLYLLRGLRRKKLCDLRLLRCGVHPLKGRKLRQRLQLPEKILPDRCKRRFIQTAHLHCVERLVDRHPRSRDMQEQIGVTDAVHQFDRHMTKCVFLTHVINAVIDDLCLKRKTKHDCTTPFLCFPYGLLQR